MIGSLLYLMTSRSDIMFNTCLCVRFQSYPKKSHLVAVKRIIRYLKRTIVISLWSKNQTIFHDELFGCLLFRL